MFKNSVVFDAEGDGLDPTKIHCVCFQDSEGVKGDLTDYKDIRDFFRQYDTYVGHNIRRFDFYALKKVCDIDIPSKAVDTLFISWILQPERKRHGLADYGEEFGIKKPEVDDWEGLDIEEYLNRCREDVRINTRLWKEQLQELQKLYGDDKKLLQYLNYIDFKAKSAALAERSRWRLDEASAEAAIEGLTAEEGKKEEVLALAIPDIPIKKKRKTPSAIYKKDGSPSVAGEAWFGLLASQGLPDTFEGEVEEIVGYEKGNLGSHSQIKAWLYDLGWVPTTFKFQRNKKTGETKEIPQVNRPKNKGGGLCESVLLLAEKEPALEELDSFFVIKHRISVLNGFLRDQKDGFLTASVAGLTNTLRFKHAEIVNLPKTDGKYAEGIRSALVARDGKELCGTDMSSLEDKIKQHFLFKHDPEYVRELQREGYDPHLDLAMTAGKVTKGQVEAYVSGSDKSIKPLRDIYKNGNYSCQYGAGGATVARTCGVTLSEGTAIQAAYWKRNWAIKAVAEEQVTKKIKVRREGKTVEKMFLLNPINGFYYELRAKKDVFSTLVQGTGVFCFDMYLKATLDRRPQVTGQFHDEFILEVNTGYREETKKFLLESIQKVNDTLRLDVLLAVDIQFGTRYSDIH